MARIPQFDEAQDNAMKASVLRTFGVLYGREQRPLSASEVRRERNRFSVERTVTAAYVTQSLDGYVCGKKSFLQKHKGRHLRTRSNETYSLIEGKEKDLESEIERLDPSVM